MAMTKAERAEFDALKTQLALAKALCFCGFSVSKIDITTGEGTGWYANLHSMSVVEVRWKDGVVYRGKESNGARMLAGAIYNTEREGYISIRLEYEDQAAKRLLLIDEKLAALT